MKFTCLKENLLKGLTIVTPISRKASHLPILNNIQIITEVGGIRLVATNLEIALRCLVRAKVEQEGNFTFPAKLLLDFVSSLSEDKIECELQDQSLKIIAGDFKGSIKCMAPEEFPLIPKVSKNFSVKINRASGEEAISRVIFAAAKNDPRQELNGVFVSLHEEKATLAATDSFRLAEVKLPLEGRSSGEPKEIIIPGRTMDELMRVLHEEEAKESQSFTFSLDETQALFEVGGVEIISRLVDGKYPDYQQIIPAKFSTTARVSREKLITTIKTVSLFSHTGLHEITMKLEPQESAILCSAKSDQLGEGAGEVGAELQGDSQQAVFNHHYLLDGLHAFKSEEIELSLVDGNSPAIIKSQGDQTYLYLVMPIKQ